MITRYDLYKFRETKSSPCSGCGKKIRRTRTFTGTCNPYSTPPWMTRNQMAEHLFPVIAQWRRREERHAACNPEAEAV